MQKSPIPAHYLSDKKRKYRKITLMDLLTLLWNVRAGAKTDDVGFLDADNTLQSLTKKLNRKVWVDQSSLESGLWSCNLMAEVGKFQDLRDRTFETFLKDVLGATGYHRFYCLIEEKK